MNRIGIALLLAASTACMGQQQDKPDPLNADETLKAVIRDFRWDAPSSLSWLPSDSLANAGTIVIGDPDSGGIVRFMKDGKVVFNVNNDGSVETADPANLDANTKEFWRVLALNYQLACKQNPKEHK